MENTLEHAGIGSTFLNRIPIAQQLRQKIDNCDYMKLKNFCITSNLQTEDTAHRMGENLYQLHI
jgi:hypothetical protein